MKVWISLLAFVPICWSSWVVQIIKPRTSVLSDGFKEKAEAELSLFTESLGFVDDEHVQYSTPAHNFFQKYLRLKLWYEASDTKITKIYFNGHGVNLCTAYLSDPIFREQRISLFVFNNANTFTTEWKYVKFRYSTRELALVKVVKCPIQRYREDIHKYEESKLYFQEIRHSEQLNEPQRGYFVFANSKDSWGHDEPLEFLMYTSCNGIQLPDMNETGEEAEFRKSSREPVLEGFTIKFTVKKRFHPPKTKVRLFGEEAEIVFLTKKYGFVNHQLPLWKKKEFLRIMDGLKKDYEVNADKLQKVKRSNPVTVCKNYIENNDQLKQRHIHTKKDISEAKIAWVSKSVRFPDSKILSEIRDLELLQCPAIFTGGYLYILPVHYMKTGKAAQVFTFKEVGKNTNKVIPFILSPVNGGDFEESPRILQIGPAKEEKNPKMGSDPAKIGPSSSDPFPNLINF